MSSTPASDRATCVASVERAAERVAPADHLRRVADQLAEALVLALQVRSLERVLDHEQHAVAGERLLEEVEGAAARGLDRVADGAVAGDHHHRRGIVALLERRAARRCRCRRAAARRAGTGRRGPGRAAAWNSATEPQIVTRVALALEDQPQRQADVRLVVDDDDAMFAGHARRPGLTARLTDARGSDDAEPGAAELARRPA